MRSRRAAGFTLVEVMAAIVLVAIVLPVAMRGISIATNVGAQAKHEAEAALLAHSKLNELAATKQWQAGVTSGDFGEDQPAYKWRADVKDWDDSTLKEIDVHVIWTANGSEHEVLMSTLVDSGTN